MTVLLRKPDLDQGICFAWTPKRTPHGIVWLEWVHWRRFEGWGWGSGDTFEYARWIPKNRYDAGERRVFSTPPGDPKKFCKNFRTDGPTPCHYPHCKRLDEHGDERCDVDNTKFGEW